MHEFRTILKVKADAKNTMRLNDKIFTIGSCFSDAIGSKMVANKITTLVNPFGTIYNPLSLHKVVGHAIENAPVQEHTFLQNQDIHLNYNFHSQFSSVDKKELESQLLHTIDTTHQFLKQCNWLIITYGTSWVYERNDTKEVVANCHKMPAKLFTKKLLSQASITDSFDNFYKKIKALNPALKIIVTVSPVRHIKDTLELNNVSKSLLRLCCHNLTENFNDVVYFPSYEIMMDDLRDYRFYKEDMIHPTEQAEEYIWEQFIDCYFDEQSKKFFTTWKSIHAALHHKPFHQRSSGHKNFLENTLQRIQEHKPIVNVDEEIEFLQKQIDRIQH